MPRGGYQKPSKPAAVSGPGKFSKRTDGTQPVRTPPLSGSDLQYGDVQRLQAAQRVAPLPNGVPAPQPQRLQGQPPAPSGEQLPLWIFDMPSSRPNEPPTAGMDAGPGPGSDSLLMSKPPEDVREVVLQYLYETYENADALQQLHELRGQRGVASNTGIVQVGQPGNPGNSEVMNG